MEFLNLGVTDIWGWIILEFLMFSDIHGLRPPDTSSIAQVVTAKNVSGCCQISQGIVVGTGRIKSEAAENQGPEKEKGNGRT